MTQASGPHYIGAWEIEPLSICDDIIHNFETKNRSNQAPGNAGEGEVNLAQKNSRDVSIAPRDFDSAGNEIFVSYLQILTTCYQDYADQWPFLKEAIPSLDIGVFNIQRYEAGQHFNKVHTERCLTNMEREFAFMTYLNDVEDGGSTYFCHYDIQIQPKKGLTMIWPAMWTHAHKGNVVQSGKKYIITGWMDLCQEIA
ncbi:2OG-Fe(II) oxygenase [Prochlorococcus marinus]|uniref:2OG-Fe(II) oxygenase n=1 Tax=Prochlorococcus TaxID=1218 RepID=UPI001F42E9A2|nr:2OG-Fe(II) oxygenase [Prochlorococcus marinus]